MKSNLSTTIAEGMVVGQLQSAFNHINERANYGLNLLDPIIIPGPADLIHLRTIGFGDPSLINRGLKAHGINPEIDLWDAAFQAALTYPSVDECLNGMYRGEISQENGNRWIMASGLNDRTLFNYHTHKPVRWQPEELRVLHALGSLDWNTYNSWLAASGMTLPEDRAKFELLYQSLTWQETMSAWNRGYIDEAKAEEWFKLEGLTDRVVIETAKKLRYQIPSPSELIEFSVKEVWNRAIVQQFGYDDEFDQIPEYVYWMSAAGYGGPTTMTNPATGEAIGEDGAPANWAQAWWRAHWRVVSNEQVYEMLHRLRPTGGPNGGPRITKVPGTDKEITPVTITDVENVLKVNDYPPYWRDKLAALSYRVLRLVDIRRIVQLSLESEQFKKDSIGEEYTIKQWAAENYQDRGQTPEDAETLATLAIATAQAASKRKEVAKNATANSRYFRAAQAAYKLGTITRAQATTRFNLVGFTGDAAQTLLDAIDAENESVCRRATLAMIRKEFIKGHYSLEQTQSALRNAGIVSEAVARYISCWRSLQTTEIIQRNTMETQSLLQSGITSHEDAMARLQNLGWDDPELLLDVALIERDAKIGMQHGA